MTDTPSKKLVFLGWDAADWQLMRPLIEQGRMPNLKRVMDAGAWGNLSTLDPILSPMLWNSIATGKRPQKHNILGFIEPKPDGSGVRPVSSTSRTARAFWNIFHHAGLRGHVLNWFASHPAEPINGAVVTNIYAALKADGDKLAPLPPHTVSPETLAGDLSGVRVGPTKLRQEVLRRFVAPDVQLKPKRDAHKLGHLSKMVAEMASVQAGYMHLLRHEPWDYAAVYFGAVDHFCHHFIEFMPPQMPDVARHDMLNFREVVNECYVYHDKMLAETLKEAGDDALLMICSDHGFLNGQLRPTKEVDPAAWHRFHGMVLLHGPGIAKNEELIGATLLDITPTLLTLMGLPVGEDMDGKVLEQAFETPPTIERIPSWEDVEGDFGEHPADMKEDAFEAQESLRQLVELGYIDAPDGDVEAQIEIARREQQVNLAAAYQFAGQLDEAEQIWDGILKDYPDEARFLLKAAELNMSRRQFDKAETLLAHCEATHGPMPQVCLYRSHIAIATGDLDAADQQLAKAQQLGDQSLMVHMKVGEVHRKRRDYPRALAAYGRMLKLDPDTPLGHAGRAEVLLKMKDYEEAAEAALTATERLFFLPPAHLTLGLAIARLGEIEQAIQCVEVAARQSPSWISPHRLLVRLYKMAGKDEDAQEQRDLLKTLYEQLAQQQPAQNPA
ncbi:alkaline phosphatase family protein [Phycisphaeraceae bacterium D3-23]